MNQTMNFLLKKYIYAVVGAFCLWGGYEIAFYTGAIRVSMVLFLFFLLIALLVTLFKLQILYQFYHRIHEGQEDIDPACSVGFLFIPIFNLFWTFYIYMSMITRLRRFAQKKNIYLSVRGCPYIAMLAIVLMWLGVVLLVSSLYGYILIFMGVFLISYYLVLMVKGMNNLNQTSEMINIETKEYESFVVKKTILKKLYRWGVLITIVTIFNCIATYWRYSQGSDSLLIFITTIIVFILMMIVEGFLLYQLWKTIAGHLVALRRVGFLFIPFYNCYTHFQAYVGWVNYFNRVKNKKLFLGLALMSSVLWIFYAVALMIGTFTVFIFFFVLFSLIKWMFYAQILGEIEEV